MRITSLKLESALNFYVLSDFDTGNDTDSNNNNDSDSNNENNNDKK